MKEQTSRLEYLYRLDRGFWWPFFCFMAVTVITTGVTLTEIFAPSYPPLPEADFDPVRFCLTTKGATVRCEAFFESDVAQTYLSDAEFLEEK